MNTGRLLIVTPCHNEATRLPLLGKSLLEQSALPDCLWVIVDDGSSDDTGQVASDMRVPFEKRVVASVNAGGLKGGSAFKAWQRGIDSLAAEELATMSWVMKLDADVVLDRHYFANLFQEAANIDVTGGVISSVRHREQRLHVPGPVKTYSARGYSLLESLPREIGFDVMDEIAVAVAGGNVRVVRGARFDVSRPIGASEGRAAGRARNGRVCRWVGYAPEYFLLHVLRYFFRRPYGVGAVAMVAGYMRAGSGPYAVELKRAHRSSQRAKLRQLARHPFRWMREVYGT